MQEDTRGGETSKCEESPCQMFEPREGALALRPEVSRAPDPRKTKHCILFKAREGESGSLQVVFKHIRQRLTSCIKERLNLCSSEGKKIVCMEMRSVKSFNNGWKDWRHKISFEFFFNEWSLLKFTVPYVATALEETESFLFSFSLLFITSWLIAF